MRARGSTVLLNAAIGIKPRKFSPWDPTGLLTRSRNLVSVAEEELVSLQDSNTLLCPRFLTEGKLWFKITINL